MFITIKLNVFSEIVLIPGKKLLRKILDEYFLSMNYYVSNSGSKNRNTFNICVTEVSMTEYF